MKTAMKLISVALALVAAAAYGQQYPKPAGYVSDFANLLTRDQAESLDAELAAFEKKTTVEVAVVTVPGLNGQSVEDYTRGLANQWGVGKKGKDNGVVFLVAVSDRKMRIEVASGARAVLTSSRTDEIRDSEVLPRFRSGDMAQGIIGGTRALMRAFDPIPAEQPATVGGAQVPQTPQAKEWTSEDAQFLGYLLGGTIGFVLLLCLIGPAIRNARARTYVLQNKGPVAVRFREAEKKAGDPDVKPATRKKLADLKGRFAEIDRLSSASKAPWAEARRKLSSTSRSLSLIASEITDEISFAKKARSEGPKLMKEIPGMIASAEKKLAEGNQSKDAAARLKQAKSQYERAQAQASDSGTLDWILLYMILNDAQSNVAAAESSHYSANYDSGSSDSGTVSSTDFGGGVDFGGGSFDGGGGSSGSW